ncbi:MAG: TRAP transporter substrate-binding protein [Oscillospiraceae bacterium]|nr:TRAP transporter substrate-binding protein [Oscillospiraceae bacterium]
MKNKTLLAFSLSAIILAGTVAVSMIAAGSKKDEEIILTYAEVNPIDGTIAGEMAKAFKEKTEELSDGTIRIDIQAGGVLGSEDQILDNLLGGGNVADISRISAFALTQYGCKDASLLGIPYTFVDEEHFWNFAQSDLAQEFLMEPHNIGLPLRGLCYGEEGFRHFFFTDIVKDISDLKNKKIRVSSDPIMTGMVDNLGGSAASVSFTELYSALSTGVVDGAEQPVANYRSNAFDEVAPYLVLDGHTLGVMQIVMADYSWDRLNEEQHGWIMEASQYASLVCREKVAEIEEQNFGILREKGVTIIEVDDKEPWISACKPITDKYSSELSDLYAEITDMQ